MNLRPVLHGFHDYRSSECCRSRSVARLKTARIHAQRGCGVGVAEARRDGVGGYAGGENSGCCEVAEVAQTKAIVATLVSEALKGRGRVVYLMNRADRDAPDNSSDGGSAGDQGTAPPGSGESAEVLGSGCSRRPGRAAPSLGGTR